MDSQVLASGTDSDLCMAHLEDVDELSEAQIIANPLTGRAMTTLDMRAYAAVLGATKGPEHLSHISELRSKVHRGNARLALKTLDVAHGHETGEVADQAAEEAVEKKEREALRARKKAIMSDSFKRKLLTLTLTLIEGHH